jgi:hypothetical protein
LCWLKKYSTQIIPKLAWWLFVKLSFCQLTNSWFRVTSPVDNWEVATVVRQRVVSLVNWPLRLGGANQVFKYGRQNGWWHWKSMKWRYSTKLFVFELLSNRTCCLSDNLFTKTTLNMTIDNLWFITGCLWHDNTKCDTQYEHPSVEQFLPSGLGMLIVIILNVVEMSMQAPVDNTRIYFWPEMSTNKIGNRKEATLIRWM